MYMYIILQSVCLCRVCVSVSVSHCKVYFQHPKRIVILVLVVTMYCSNLRLLIRY